MTTIAEDLAAEDAAHTQYAAVAWAEIRYVAQCLQPDEDVLDTRRAGLEWARLRRAWVAAGEPDTFGAFADTALATLNDASMA